MKPFLTSLFIIVLFGISHAQATASFKASATIIQPIGITNVSNLNFAEVDAKAGGEIILTPEETRLVSGNSTLGDGSSVTAAAFEVTGDQNFTYSITLPLDSYKLTNGPESMVIKDFTSNQGAVANLAGGRSLFKIGATLEINSQQSPGKYSSTTPMNVTVNYN